MTTPRDHDILAQATEPLLSPAQERAREAVAAGGDAQRLAQAYGETVAVWRQPQALPQAQEDEILAAVVRQARASPAPRRTIPVWRMTLVPLALAAGLLFVLRPAVDTPVAMPHAPGAPLLAAAQLERPAEGLVVAWRPGSQLAALERRGELLVLPLAQGAVDVSYNRPPDAPPLLVETPVGDVYVVGTVFHVAVLDATLSVAVSRGRVDVWALGEAPETLAAGEAWGTAWQTLSPVDPVARAVPPMEAPPAALGSPRAPQPSELEVMYRAVEAALTSGQKDQARETLRAITMADRTGPTGTLARFDLAQLLLEAGQLADAVELWREAIQAGLGEPLLSRARLGLCTVALRRDDVAQGAACLRELRGAPAHTARQAAILEGKLLCMQRRFEEAEQAFFRAQEQAPPRSNVEAAVSLGRLRCTIVRGELNRAKLELLQFRRQHSDSPSFSQELLDLDRLLAAPPR